MAGGNALAFVFAWSSLAEEPAPPWVSEGGHPLGSLRVYGRQFKRQRAIACDWLVSNSMADLAIVALVATIGVLMAPASPLLIADLLAAQLAGDLTDCRDGTPRYTVRRGHLSRSSWSFYVE